VHCAHNPQRPGDLPGADTGQQKRFDAHLSRAELIVCDAAGMQRVPHNALDQSDAANGVNSASKLKNPEPFQGKEDHSHFSRNSD